MNGKLKKHLMEIDKLAEERVEFLIKQQAERQNVDEKLKEKIRKVVERNSRKQGKVKDEEKERSSER